MHNSSIIRSWSGHHMHNIDNWKGSIIQLTSFTLTASTNNYVYHQVHDELFGLTIMRGIIQPAAFQLSPSINTPLR